MIDIHDAMDQRADIITSNPDRIVRVEAFSDGRNEWGIMTVMDSDRNVRRFEFYESEDSWKRKGAMSDYQIGMDRGVPVYVVVPDSAYSEFNDALERSGGSRVNISTYGRCQIPTRILA